MRPRGDEFLGFGWREAFKNEIALEDLFRRTCVPRGRVPFVAAVLFAMTPTPDSCFVTTSGFSQSAAHHATAGANFIASVYRFSVLCLAAEPYEA